MSLPFITFTPFTCYDSYLFVFLHFLPSCFNSGLSLTIEYLFCNIAFLIIVIILCYYYLFWLCYLSTQAHHYQCSLELKSWIYMEMSIKLTSSQHPPSCVIMSFFWYIKSHPEWGYGSRCKIRYGKHKLQCSREGGHFIFHHEPVILSPLTKVFTLMWMKKSENSWHLLSHGHSNKRPSGSILINVSCLFSLLVQTLLSAAVSSSHRGLVTPQSSLRNWVKARHTFLLTEASLPVLLWVN